MRENKIFKVSLGVVLIYTLVVASSSDNLLGGKESITNFFLNIFANNNQGSPFVICVRIQTVWKLHSHDAAIWGLCSHGTTQHARIILDPWMEFLLSTRLRVCLQLMHVAGKVSGLLELVLSLWIHIHTFWNPNIWIFPGSDSVFWAMKPLKLEKNVHMVSDKEQITTRWKTVVRRLTWKFYGKLDYT